MHRISSQLSSLQAKWNLMRQEASQAKSLNQMGTQNRIDALRDDPVAAGHLVRYDSFKGRIERFEKNANVLTNEFNLREGYMQHAVDVMQRVRELCVTGANGVYTKEDMKNVAGEVDCLLRELCLAANAKDGMGQSLFAGTRSEGDAFDIEMGTAPGSVEPVITGVKYNGNMEKSQVEIDNNAYIEVDKSGSKVFWAEPQMVMGQRDATSWQAQDNALVVVDGIKIQVEKGDNLYALVAKINDSGAAVKASVDPITQGLNITTIDARQLWLEDANGTTLEDLGLIKDAAQRPPYNIGDDARVSGASLFDTVIALRDALLKGDGESVGGRILGSVDSALNNLLVGISHSGSDSERLMMNAKRSSAVALNVTEDIAREGDVDFTKAVVDMKMMEAVNQATLAASAKLYSSTLLNYIK